MSNQLQQQDPMRPLIQDIMRYEDHLKAVLPKGTIDASRIVRLVVSQVKKNPKLAFCDRVSVLGAIVRAVQTGVEPELCYLIPFGKQCNLVFDYKAKMEMARRHPDVLDVQADIVYENDEFSYYKNDERTTFLHRFDCFGERGKVIGYYAMARMRYGGVNVHPMSIAEVEKHRDKHALSKTGPWKTDFDAMAKKTCVHQLCKMLPKTSEMAQALASDNDALEVAQNNHLLIDKSHEPEYETSDDATTVADVNRQAKIEAAEDRKTHLVNALIERAGVLQNEHGATQGDIEERIGSKIGDLNKCNEDQLAAMIEVLN